MFFNKKTVSTKEFFSSFLYSHLDKINQEFTSQIFVSLQKENIIINKSKKEVELEVAILLNHILGKLFGKLGIIKPYTPEGLSLSIEMFEYLYSRWGNGSEYEVFITKIRKKFMEKVKSYETYEIAYSRSEMLLEDFEACVTVILLEIKYQELTRSFVNVVAELHKGSTIILYEVLKNCSKKFKVINREVS